MITAFSQHNCGGSDAGTAAIIAATLWAVHDEMGIQLTSETLGRATPSESLLREWEHQYAAELFITWCHEMKACGTKYLHAACDHGHRNGQDSLVKGVRDKNG